MKVLWIVNTIFPYPAKMLGQKKNVFGGWMLGLMDSIVKNKDIKLGVATVYTGKELKKYEENGIVYYLIPTKDNTKYSKKIEIYWEQINKEFNPDLVHLHGTEYAHGLAFLRACPKVKSVVSIQGLVSLYGELYLNSIEFKDVLKNTTLRDIIKMDNMYQSKKKYLKRGKYEIEVLNRADRIVGRTTWDYGATMMLADEKKYVVCNESLRKEYYSAHWDYDNVNKHTIFISQASYPIKGFHEILKILPDLRKRYPDILVYVAGTNILDVSTLKKRMKITGYTKYLNRIIKKYKLEDIIQFTGLLDAQQMVDKMLKSNVFVQTSVIENSPNSLGEAMLLGMPIVASNVGGTADMLIDQKEGYLYPFGEGNITLKYISDVFDNPKKAIELGKKAREHALITHNRDKNSQNMVNIYRSIINENKE